MDSHQTSTEESLQTLLACTAALQAGNEALVASMAALRDGQKVLQDNVTGLQVDVAGIKGLVANYATQAEVERVRSELYKAIEAQTWRLFTLMTAVCSGLTLSVYYIARNVH
jgi:hypothetical protein